MDKRIDPAARAGRLLCTHHQATSRGRRSRGTDWCWPAICGGQRVLATRRRAALPLPGSIAGTACGFVQSGAVLLVSRGSGDTFPVRFNCPREDPVQRDLNGDAGHATHRRVRKDSVAGARRSRDALREREMPWRLCSPNGKVARFLHQDKMKPFRRRARKTSKPQAAKQPGKARCTVRYCSDFHRQSDRSVADSRTLELRELRCNSKQRAGRRLDLSPLTGMPLEVLLCDRTLITDLSPLAGMKLKHLSFTPSRELKGLPAIRRRWTAWWKLGRHRTN